MTRPKAKPIAKNPNGRPPNCGKCNKPKTQCKCGRPTKMTPETLEKLERAFSIGCSDVEACLYAGISKTALYSYIEKNPEFRDRKEDLKESPVLKARTNIISALDKGDRDISKWYLESKRKEEFGRNGPTTNIAVIAKGSEAVSNTSEWLIGLGFGGGEESEIEESVSDRPLLPS